MPNMGAVDADGIMATSEDMIAISAHRGFWTEPAEKNSRQALERRSAKASASRQTSATGTARWSSVMILRLATA